MVHAGSGEFFNAPLLWDLQNLLVYPTLQSDGESAEQNICLFSLDIAYAVTKCLAI